VRQRQRQLNDESLTFCSPCIDQKMKSRSPSTNARVGLTACCAATTVSLFLGCACVVIAFVPNQPRWDEQLVKALSQNRTTSSIVTIWFATTWQSVRTQAVVRLSKRFSLVYFSATPLPCKLLHSEERATLARAIVLRCSFRNAQSEGKVGLCGLSKVFSILSCLCRLKGGSS
jgi:hypothetical protein